VLIEMIERDKVAVHPDVAAAVDYLGTRHHPMPEIRSMGENDEILIEKPALPPLPGCPEPGFRRAMVERAPNRTSMRRGGRLSEHGRLKQFRSPIR
jgi:hypothetical protein